MIQIGIQLISCIQQVHELGFVYNDLKPDNILIGNSSILDELKNNQINNCNLDKKELFKVRLIDFGLMTSYLDEQGHHIAPGLKDYFRGSLDFASKNSHYFMRNSRRDDLISLVYNLIYLLDRS